MARGFRLFGPVGINRHQLEQRCELNTGHAHYYDHWTVLWTGRVEVQYRETQDGPVTERRRYRPLSLIFVAAHRFHTFKVIAGTVRYWCVFFHRDWSGAVIWRFKGNQHAYRETP